MISIRELQGDVLLSPFAGQSVTTAGVVTAITRRGFFLQTPDVKWDGKGSNAIFVYARDLLAATSDSQIETGIELEVTGQCVDFIKHDTAKPVTQIKLESAKLINTNAGEIAPVTLTNDLLPLENDKLATLLNSLEGMLVRIPAGQRFIAPSNRYGDYVLAMDAEHEVKDALRTEQGGVIVEASNPLRWFPGFRVTNYNHAQRLNVGAKLLSDVIGPLNYRVDAYQIAMSQPFKTEANFVSLTKSSLVPSDGSLTIMTLNCFNLDPHVESEALVMNPRQDVDDDWGEGRFHTLAQAVVLQANMPDIVALQEIQDNDGAEMSEVVDASETYALLIQTIEQLTAKDGKPGLRYQWVDVEPVLNADGGQPGGNIRNAYLYNPERVSLDEKSVIAFGRDEDCFTDSRKPLLCEFVEKHSGQRLAIINIHLASKRHQESIFAPDNPGVDAKLEVRTEQAKCVRLEVERLIAAGVDYYVTGDFNDTEHSLPLRELCAEHSFNLVDSLPQQERYDYNHRGKLQVLMHGIVSKQMADKAEYEIIHGNELIGVTPGEESDKPSDHAYVIAKLGLAQ